MSVRGQSSENEPQDYGFANEETKRTALTCKRKQLDDSSEGHALTGNDSVTLNISMDHLFTKKRRLISNGHPVIGIAVNQAEDNAVESSFRRENSSLGKRSCNSTMEVYNDDELRNLEAAGMPDPVRPEIIQQITEAIHEAVNEDIVVCTVCDEMFPRRCTQLLEVCELPKKLFEVLQKPRGEEDGVDALPQALVEQYDVSKFFPGTPQFVGVLLSPRGLHFEHEQYCQTSMKSEACCQVKLYICESNRCLQALRRGTIPKFAIAQGNYIGQLPTGLRDLSVASRALLRPVQSYGRLAAYLNNGGTRMTGHVYSNKLNTALVRTKLPLLPDEVPLRVLVTSPFASDKSTSVRAKVASVSEEYIIQRRKIANVLQYFRDVGNSIMKTVEIDQNVIEQLPNGEIAPQMVYMEENTILPDIGIENVSNDSPIVQVQLDDYTGGPSLCRSNKECDDAIFISNTITVGAMQPNEKNAHEQVVSVLTNREHTGLYSKYTEYEKCYCGQLCNGIIFSSRETTNC